MFRLSPTTGLNLFRECPRCFWLHYNKRVQRPRGIFPSLPGGMDLVIKKYFDRYRGTLPPEIEGKVEGSLMPDVELMDKWRNWRTGLEYYDKDLDAVLFGALDDCLIDEDPSVSPSPNGIAGRAGQAYYIPLDYKTRGSAPKYGDSERYYQTQLDAYGLLLSTNDYKTRNFAYLVYYYPIEVGENGLVKFDIKPVKVETDIERAKNTFCTAVELLRGPMPEHNNNCEYCCWLSNRLDFE
jgi:hypothetical protein